MTKSLMKGFLYTLMSSVAIKDKLPLVSLFNIHSKSTQGLPRLDQISVIFLLAATGVNQINLLQSPRSLQDFSLF